MYQLSPQEKAEIQQFLKTAQPDTTANLIAEAIDNESRNRRPRKQRFSRASSRPESSTPSPQTLESLHQACEHI